MTKKEIIDLIAKDFDKYCEVAKKAKRRMTYNRACHIAENLANYLDEIYNTTDYYSKIVTIEINKIFEN